METTKYYVRHLLKVKLFPLKAYSESLIKGKKTIEFDKCKNRYNTDIKLAMKYLTDIGIYTYSSVYCSKEELGKFLAAINSETTAEGLLEAIKNNIYILEYVLEQNDYNDAGVRYILEECYRPEGNIFKYDSCYENIVRAIKVDNHVRIFDPQCQSGKNIKKLVECLDNPTIETYGLDDERFGIYEAKEIINRTIIGTLRGSKISNEAFDILFLKPRPQIELEYSLNNSIKDSNEKNMLKQTYKFLKPQGLLIYTVPFYRMYNDMWYFIAKNFSNVSVISHDTTDKLITIYGIKEHNKKYSETLNELLNLEYGSLERYSSIEYHVYSNPENEVQLFRGSVIDIHELTDIINNDGLYNEFYKTFDDSKQKKDTSPLLPFNLGQIGLILTSGELDGIVEEIPGVNHVIKGMTVKTVDSEEIKDSQNNTVTCKNTISNMVQLNAFTADGDFISIN